MTKKIVAVEPRAVHAACEAMLSVLSDADIRVPASDLEPLVSGKAILRAVLGGGLVIGEYRDEEPDEEPDEGE